MCRKSFLLFIIATSSFSNSATQTAWEPLQGHIPGPVLAWNAAFFWAEHLLGFAGSIHIAYPLETIAYPMNGPRSVNSGDIDGDGDMDLLGAAAEANEIVWWENTDGSGSSWIMHLIDSEFAGAHCIAAVDIDNDGILDVVGAASDADEITWWHNTGSNPFIWTRHVIASSFEDAWFVYPADVNADGYADVVGANADATGEVIWWENENGTGMVWTPHSIDTAFKEARSVFCTDMDLDGDADVLGAAYGANQVTLWENTNGQGTAWTEHLIAPLSGAHSVEAADMDSDGDQDVVAAGFNADLILWYENDPASRTPWEHHQIQHGFDGARAVDVADVDQDGDMDVAGASNNDQCMAWWENSDGVGGSWIAHPICGGFEGAYSVHLVDIDGSGFLDAAGAAHLADQVIWSNLQSYDSGTLESSILYLGNDPAGTLATVDWSPPGSGIGIQVRASDDFSAMGDWSDLMYTPGDLTGILEAGDSYLQYRLVMEQTEGREASGFNEVTFTWTPVGTHHSSSSIGGFDLLPFRPNPSRYSVMIRFELPEVSQVDVTLFDLTGHVVETIRGRTYPEGHNSLLSESLPPGVYFCTLTAAEFSEMEQFVIIE